MPGRTLSIPIVDLAPFSSKGSEESKQKAAKALYSACHDLGFVQITGHGVSKSLLDEAFDWSKRLFDLSHEDKMKAPHPDGPIPHRGYSHPGLEKVYSKAELAGETASETDGDSLRQVMDFKESYEVGSENNPAQYNIWLPEDVLPGFRKFMMYFYWELHKTASIILDALSVALNLTDEERAHLRKLHTGENNQLRFLRYPEISAEQLAKRIIARMPAHCDWSCFTLLFQDECGGLEFELPDQPGTFIPADFVPGALALNVGDMLQRFSNDIFPSASHRVVLPKIVLEGRTAARYSIPYFVAPDNDEIVSCLPTCVTEERPLKFAPVSFAEYGANSAKYSYKRAPKA